MYHTTMYIILLLPTHWYMSFTICSVFEAIGAYYNDTSSSPKYSKTHGNLKPWVCAWTHYNIHERKKMTVQAKTCLWAPARHIVSRWAVFVRARPVGISSSTKSAVGPDLVILIIILYYYNTRVLLLLLLQGRDCWSVAITSASAAKFRR